MKLNIILGINMDNEELSKYLSNNHDNDLVILDYESIGETRKVNGITYISPNNLKIMMKEYDTLIFHKTLCSYPGMSGIMSSLFKGKSD